MIYAGPVCRGWPGLVLRPMSPIKSSTTSLARSQALRQFTSATSFSRSGERRLINGEPMSASFSSRYANTTESI